MDCYYSHFTKYYIWLTPILLSKGQMSTQHSHGEQHVTTLSSSDEDFSGTNLRDTYEFTVQRKHAFARYDSWKNLQMRS